MARRTAVGGQLSIACYNRRGMFDAAQEANTFPERRGRYELLLPIATGGMATVYLARAHGLAGFEREVALKLMHPHLRADAADAAVDLLEEAKLAAQIRHPNVVAVLDVGEDPQGVFLVMEYVEGETASTLLRAAASSGTSLPTPIVLRILADVLAGLDAAHELRDRSGTPVAVIHRDVSPQNVLVGTDGIARLTDFGIAKAANRAGATKTGLIKGKIGYMAPEQARGQPVDRRCDVWAAGVLAWELFTGRRLYTSSNDAIAMLVEMLSGPPPRARTVRPDLPAALDDAISSALQVDPARRCHSAAVLRERILEAFGGGIADASEVADHVRRLAEPRLARWKWQIDEVLERRAGRSSSASSGGAAAVTASSLPFASRAHLDARPIAELAPASGGELLDSSSAPDVAPVTGPLSSLHRGERRGHWLAAVGLATLAAIGFALLGARRVGHEITAGADAPASQVAAPPDAPPSPSDAPSSPPQVTPDQASDDAAASSAAPGATSAAPRSSVRAPSRSPSSAPVPRSGSTTKRDPLLPSPYEQESQ